MCHLVWKLRTLFRIYRQNYRAIKESVLEWSSCVERCVEIIASSTSAPRHPISSFTANRILISQTFPFASAIIITNKIVAMEVIEVECSIPFRIIANARARMGLHFD